MTNTIPKSPFHAHCTSPIFKIIAGPEGDEYTVHSSLLEKSPVLKAVVNGEWKESSERLIRWEEWDSATVSMFVEWLYTGEYCCVYPVFVERPEMDMDAVLGTFEKIKRRKEEREAAAKQSREAKAREKEANNSKSQATDAVNNGPGAAEEYPEPKTIIETPPASPEGGYNPPVVETAFYKEQLQRCANYLSDARGEKAIIKGRISELEKVMSKLQISKGGSVQVAEDLERKLRENGKSARDVSYARIDLRIQMKLQRTLISPLQELSFEPGSLEPNGALWTAQAPAVPWPWLKKLALIQGHEEFASWSGFVEHPPHSLDFTPPLLAHATLYALGQYTQIPLLQANAFRALQVVLKSVHPMSAHSLAARGFAKLVQYVYAHIAAGEPLRELVAGFAAWNQTTLLLEREYRWVLESGGDFVLDLTEMLTRRLAKDR